MSKIQEALDNLKGIQITEEDVLADCAKLETIDEDMNVKEFSPIQAFEVLTKFAAKVDKYKWHDLRKDPNVLPEENTKVLILSSCDGRKNVSIAYYYAQTKCFDFKEASYSKYIAWKYIEEFEDGI